MVKNPPANAGDSGSSPGLGGSHMPQSSWARAPQLLSLRSVAREPQLLKPALLEPVLCSKRSHLSEVLYSRFSLDIYFIHSINSVYMSIPISQFIPLSPFPLGIHMFVCSLSLCLYFCFTDRFICTIFLDSTYMR